MSDTETPDRPDLYPTWDGRQLTSHAGHLEWLHTGRDWTWRATVQDFGEDFRADEGFVTQVGYRRAAMRSTGTTTRRRACSGASSPTASCATSRARTAS